MEKKLIILVALCVICSSVGSAQAVSPTTYQWFGSNGVDPPTTDWMDGQAWRDEATGLHGTSPTAVDRVKLNGVWGNAGPDIGGIHGVQSVAAGEIFMSEGPPDLAPQSLTVSVGGTLTTGGGAWLGQVNIGYASHNTGSLIGNGGTANVTQHLWLGWNGKGILQMNSGTVNVGAMFAPGAGTTFGGNVLATGSAEIHLDGGLLHTQEWWGAAGFLGVHNYTFDITGGMWEQHGFFTEAIQSLVDSGWITAYGGAGTVIVEWDALREITVVTGIPEPITLSLLGLGALLLRRRS
jgi:hypothetical protein